MLLVLISSVLIYFNYFYIEIIYLNLHNFEFEEKKLLDKIKDTCDNTFEYMSFDQRMNFYLNSWSTTEEKIGNVNLTISNEILIDKAFFFDYSKFKRYWWSKIELWPETVYGKELDSVLSRVNPQCNLAFSLGDKYPQINNFPLLTKVRSVDNKYNVLLKLQSRRHFDSISSVFTEDIPYDYKINKVVWRGVTTGYGRGQRGALLSKIQTFQQSKLLDIGFNGIVQGMERNVSTTSLRSSLSRHAMLKYKGILMLEGNDVASGLKWALLSNSVVFMPKPTVESWFLESKLVPFVHYVLLKDDLSDLEEMADWCFYKNVEECKQIALESTCFASQFLNRAQEVNLQNKIIEKIDALFLKNNMC
jgi:hypothetical protein